MTGRVIAHILPGPSVVISTNSQHYTKELCCIQTVWMCFHQVIFTTGPTGYDLQHTSETRLKFLSHSLSQVSFNYHTILGINTNTIQWTLLEIKSGFSQHFIWNPGPPTAMHWNDITVHTNYNNNIFPAGLMPSCYCCPTSWLQWTVVGSGPHDAFLCYFFLCYNSQTPAMFLSQNHCFQGILWCI